ncbi:MAG: T9SS type A sorting domain-containing protein [Ignavibacteriae bacterium]|nr:T9SS type A sorting domain-containing protein [Ignavibacteriota bacterium]
MRLAVNCLVGTLVLVASVLVTNRIYAQGRDSVYFKNFVRHANGSTCTHLPPGASYMVFLNGDRIRILLETSPRWNLMGEPNIPGNGTFGVELGNFANPGILVGDSVFATFTCSATQQQGILMDVVTGIPWLRFPLTLTLSSESIPGTPQNVLLTVDSITHHRTVQWTPAAGVTYSVYRRLTSNTVAGGLTRMLYTQVALGISEDHFVDSSGLPGVRYGYVVFAVSAQGVYSVHSRDVNEDPVFAPGDDLTIGYIGRIPRLDFVWGSPNPATEGWPAVGQLVRWQANVKNWTTANLQGVAYKWIVDGIVVDSGTVNMPAGDTISVYYPWLWSFTRHELAFIIDPDNGIPEEEEQNNSLTIYTNAIGVGLYVEQSVYDYFRQYQKLLPNVHSNCWEDWAQRQVRRWNQMFANAIYPEAPNGVLDRIRLDKITIVPDAALPLAGGLPTNNPNLNDRTIDMQWGFPATLLNGGFYSNHTSTSDNNPFYYEGSLMHELGHARYLVDVYGFNVDGGTSTVAIQENGQFIAGTVYMPYVGGSILYATPITGLMNSQYTYVDRYSTSALNLIAGHRATYGNCNAPNNIGVFMQNLPAQNRLTVKDAQGLVLAGADVKVYQSTGRPGVWYGKYFDDVPDLLFTANDSGEVLLGRCPFTPTGVIQHTYGESNAILILRVQHGQRVGYTFVESSTFNFEYWRGNTALGTYEVRVHMIGLQAVEPIAGDVPHRFELSQNYPNPFNPSTTIQYAIPPGTEHVSLKVFDMLGREVATLVDERQQPGNYSVEWNGRNRFGSDVASGVYFYTLNGGNFSTARRMLLVR